MAAHSFSSSDFSSLVKKLQERPNDPALKQEILARIPQMMTLAKSNNPMGLFLLAQVYSPTSPQYRNMMRQSAAGGCTNAMLALCHLLLKSASPADLKTAAHYMQMIARSNDTYIIKESRKLLDTNPLLAAEMRGQAKPEHYNSKLRFFGARDERRVEQEAELQSSLVPAG